MFKFLPWQRERNLRIMGIFEFFRFLGKITLEKHPILHLHFGEKTITWKGQGTVCVVVYCMSHDYNVGT